ncbi:P-loop containing nucleoside triphosphate hydrolase protein [Zychaea mexicana]|uniref:P-loop containing nucleoside triphosphate hydrolase protein n=1 Tax=Zychaea mexicana TaxID=64656 RepID=UPI0022FF2317|nr:P-loop containing nucleoside triphosphate hydrolase protein [Zychaea mexicana]KAI9493593.1 P-loop containing nucleoside triphosphate hydrolase protein [Zychaea mexicana]
MAPLQIIGAGYGRTGTDSLREALEILGYRTHHMRRMHEDKDTDPDGFRNAYENPTRSVDWDRLYGNYDAAVDWPTVTFVDRLINHYPDAKVILTERDPDSWYASLRETIAKVLPCDPNDAHIGRIRSMARAIVLDGVFQDPAKSDMLLDDQEAIKAKYNAHVAWVKENVPEERLFIMKLGEGWDRLCAFLGKPVPNLPYPHSNKRKGFQDCWRKFDDGGHSYPVEPLSVKMS